MAMFNSKLLVYQRLLLFMEAPLSILSIQICGAVFILYTYTLKILRCFKMLPDMDPEKGKTTKPKMTGWWLGHPFVKYEFVNWDDDSNPMFMGT